METTKKIKKTRVINVKVKYLRAGKPAYQNLEEWLLKPRHIYIGRDMTLRIPGAVESIWANPYSIKKYKTAENACRKYRKYLVKRLMMEPELLKQLEKLKGKTLGCWCMGEHKCHGEVLVELIELYF